jgi:hypothetical protein
MYLGGTWNSLLEDLSKPNLACDIQKELGNTKANNNMFKKNKSHPMLQGISWSVEDPEKNCLPFLFAFCPAYITFHNWKGKW